MSPTRDSVLSSGRTFCLMNASAVAAGTRALAVNSRRVRGRGWNAVPPLLACWSVLAVASFVLVQPAAAPSASTSARERFTFPNWGDERTGILLRAFRHGPPADFPRRRDSIPGGRGRRARRVVHDPRLDRRALPLGPAAVAVVAVPAPRPAAEARDRARHQHRIRHPRRDAE